MTSDGKNKANARVVLIGYKHPDQVKKNPYTHRSELETASPTLSKVGRNMILQAAALDEHDMESADAKSAVIQADEHKRREAYREYQKVNQRSLRVRRRAEGWRSIACEPPEHVGVLQRHR